MTELTPELLVEVSNQMLDETAFLCTELTETPPAFAPEVLRASLAFQGPVHAELVLHVEQPLAENLAETLLALDPGSPEVTQHAEAAFGEFLNILAGALAAAWFGEEAPCKLGLPVVTRVARPAASVASPLSTISLTRCAT